MENGQNVTTGEEGGFGFLKIDSTEFGGLGFVLNRVNIAPAGQTHLAVRAKLLPGNEAKTLSVHLIPKTGDATNLNFDLGQLNEQTFTTVMVPLGKGDLSAIQQVQLQGTNFGAGARAMKLEIDALQTPSP